jgi:hypothetical protein
LVVAVNHHHVLESLVELGAEHLLVEAQQRRTIFNLDTDLDVRIGLCDHPSGVVGRFPGDISQPKFKPPGPVAASRCHDRYHASVRTGKQLPTDLVQQQQ